MKVRIEKIYEDSDLIALNKPPNVLSIPDRYDPTLFNLYQYLFQTDRHIRVVHRLDRETSGVILFARNEGSHKELNHQFQDRSVNKVYHALIQGIPLQERGKIEAPLALKSPGHYIISTKGKPAITHFEILEVFGGISLISLNPITGRTHQIRVHLQYFGYPILADRTYGTKRPFMLSEHKKRYNIKKNSTESPLLDRTALHARSIEFTHPDSQRRTSLEASYPKDFKATISQLRKIYH